MNKVSVRIFNQVYEVEVAPGDELHIYSVAQYLEQKLEEVQRDTGIVDTQKLAILSALNIADELIRLRNSKETGSGSVELKADELIRVLDKALTV